MATTPIEKQIRDDGQTISMPLQELMFSVGIYAAYFNAATRKSFVARVGRSNFANVTPYSGTTDGHFVFEVKASKPMSAARDLFAEASKRDSVLLSYDGDVFAKLIPCRVKEAAPN